MLWILGAMLVLSAIIVRIFNQAGTVGCDALSKNLFVAATASPSDTTFVRGGREEGDKKKKVKRALLLRPGVQDMEKEDEVQSNTSSDSSSNADDEAQKVFDTLSSQCLAIPIKAENVRFLPSPDVFFNRLQGHIATAEVSITMSALYVGSGPLAMAFVKSLIDRLQERPELKLTFLLDYNRMLHSCNLQTIADLVTAFSPKRVVVSLFQAPSTLSRFIPYSRAREVLGVQHTKIFCFDGVKTVLTGANLSDDYFTTRIDRYMEVKDSPELTEFYTQLVTSLTNISHQLGSSSSSSSLENNGGGGKEQQEDEVLNSRGNEKSRRGIKKVHKKSKLCIWENNTGADPSGEKEKYCELARAELSRFVEGASQRNEEYARLLLNSGKSGASSVLRSDTFIFPTLQFGRIGMSHDSAVVGSLLRGLSGNSRVYLSSPYLNIYNRFLAAMVHTPNQTHFHLITSSTQTNGWKGQKGFAGFIPQLYLQAERTLHYLMQSFGCGDRVWIHEFSLPGKTFHSKGLWVSPRRTPTQPSVFSPVKKNTSHDFLGAVFGTAPATTDTTRHSAGNRNGDAKTEGGGSGTTQMTKTASVSSLNSNNSGCSPEPPNAAEPPVCTAIGSTNYGYRSVDKDIESEVFLLSTNGPLQSRMQAELETLFDSTTVVTEERFREGADGRFQPVVSLVAQLGQGYM